MGLVESAVADVETPRVKMTIDKFLALPEDGVDRMLLDGEVWELGMTVRNRFHGRTEARIAYFLTGWLRLQPAPRGSIVSGDAGFRLRGGENALGIDVAYASAELVARTPPDALLFDGPPVLAVEILSPSEPLKAILAKIGKYLLVGTVVWEVEPQTQVVRVHCSGLPVESYNITQELVGDPYLPGFRVAVAEFFAD